MIISFQLYEHETIEEALTVKTLGFLRTVPYDARPRRTTCTVSTNTPTRDATYEENRNASGDMASADIKKDK